ncbi:maleylpyruvate isomerase N-terminal domain-containing protein [Actinacidiphila yeochonensis]|uniref:maleylpyruvate isomerase N-terminal domain-containing protein n=1 Tax=Actinacidiphila yeochonensis TaxID=89050 RepID=UPI000A8062FB|nr:maleylpyruvate isomerase N-terminal domain-containing protein [Actinacidiphila yeochonensis]
MDERAAARANARRRTGSGTAGSGTDAAGAAGAAEVLDASYRALLDVLAGLDEDASWRPTACTGWAVRDLVFHLVMDAQRGLVALHTPAAGPPDRDATGYWADWRPGTRGAADGRRFVRVGASMFLLFDQLRGLYAETASAAARAGRRRTRRRGWVRRGMC